MKNAKLQPDGTWKIEEFTAEETEDYNKTVAADKAMKEADIAATAKKAIDFGVCGSDIYGLCMLIMLF